MIAFEVSHNGKRLCTAGINGPGVLTSIVTWLSSEADGAPADEDLELRVDGLVSDGPDAGTHHEWACAQLRLGDEISVRIRETAIADAPTDSRRPDNDRELAAQHDYVRQMCQRWGWQLTES